MAAEKRSASPEKEIARALAGGKTAPVYLLYGEDGNRLKSAADQIRSHVEKSAADINTAWTQMDLRETGFQNLMAELGTISFFGGVRGIVAHNFGAAGEGERGPQDILNLDEKEREELLAYIKKPARDIVLILRPEKPDMRLKFWKSLKEEAETWSFNSNEEERGVIIAEKLKDSPLTFSPDAREWIVDRFRTNFKNLDPELEKLSVYMGEKKNVGIEDVQNCMAVPRHENIWKLTGAVVTGDIEGTLAALKSLRIQGEPYLMVLPMIAYEFRMMLYTVSGKNSGLSVEETAAKAGLKNPWGLKKYWSRGKLPKEDTVKEFLHRLSVADVRVRASGRNPWNALEDELSRFINDGKNRAPGGKKGMSSGI